MEYTLEIQISKIDKILAVYDDEDQRLGYKLPQDTSAEEELIPYITTCLPKMPSLDVQYEAREILGKVIQWVEDNGWLEEEEARNEAAEDYEPDWDLKGEEARFAARSLVIGQ